MCWCLNPLFSCGRDGHQPYSRALYTNYKDSLSKLGWPSEYEEFRPWHIFGNVFGLKGSFKTSDALWYFHVGIVVEKKRYSTERHGQNIKPPCKLMFFFWGESISICDLFLLPPPPVQAKKRIHRIRWPELSCVFSSTDHVHHHQYHYHPAKNPLILVIKLLSSIYNSMPWS